MKVSYKWLQTFFDDGALPSVDKLHDELVFHSYEVEGIEQLENDNIIDIDVLPNRSADSLSHRGIAREISTIFDIPMKDDPFNKQLQIEPSTDKLAITLDPDSSCSFYAGALINNVKIGESPKWLRERVEAIGQKSINNVVDATNYVLFELGQPTHVFDADKISGDTKKIKVRKANQKEEVRLLGGTDVVLDDTMSVIADATTDKPLAVAGVKGGTEAEVDAGTTNIIIESAKFDAVETRKTSQALKIRTDASARYENNLSDKLAIHGVIAVRDLILKVAGGEFIGFAKGGEIVSTNRDVHLKYSAISKLLGADISAADVEDIFRRLGFKYEKDSSGDYMVQAPFERRDINIAEDVIEEVGRVFGYSNIHSEQLPQPENPPKINKKFAYADIIRNILDEIGFTEVYMYSLRDKGEVKLLNSLASDKDHLRSNLSDGIVEELNKNEHNMPLLGMYDAIRVYEIGNIFKKDYEAMHVCLGVRVSGTKKREKRTAAILENAKHVLETALGVTLPDIAGEVLEFDVESMMDKLPAIEEYPVVKVLGPGIAYKRFSQYPFVLRDIAVWVQEGVSASDVLAIIQKHGGELLVRSDLFDEFSKDGRTSFAFHLVFQSHSKTLTDTEVGEVMQQIESDVANAGWEVR